MTSEHVFPRDQLAKLPKWAQHKIIRMQGELDEARSMLRKDGGSPFSAGGHPLPKWVHQVEYENNAGFKIRLWVDLQGRLTVSELGGWRGLVVVPEANNVVHLEPGRVL